MSDIFSAVADDLVASQQGTQEATSPTENKTDLAPSTQETSASSTETSTQTPSPAQVSQAIADLEKMDKFKLDGQEWTLKDLKAAIMRQKDYTQKTQGLAKEREALQEEKKFHENLAWDLEKLRKNPALVHEFVKVYPQSFHKYADEYLKASPQDQAQQNVQQAPQVDVNLLSRLTSLEKFHQAQEVERNEKAIEATMTTLSAKYPDVANFKEMVLGRAFEMHSQGTQLTPEVWETIYKSVDSEVGTLLKAKYGNLVKKQTEAHAKARDVGAGGGSVGRAPMKFTKFDDLAKHAEGVLKGGG